MSSRLKKRTHTLQLVEKIPGAISSDEEHSRILRVVRDLMMRHLNLNPEENRLLSILATLVADYEEKRFAAEREPVSPLEMLKFNMENHNHTAKDLWGVLGDKGTVSKILNGKRAISKAQAKRLGMFYHLSPALFI